VTSIWQRLTIAQEVLERLEADGLIERRRHRPRSKMFRLTARGTEEKARLSVEKPSRKP
jgi:DNA-binding PadR family transcriptional regulator